MFVLLAALLELMQQQLAAYSDALDDMNIELRVETAEDELWLGDAVAS